MVVVQLQPPGLSVKTTAAMVDMAVLLVLLALLVAVQLRGNPKLHHHLLVAPTATVDIQATINQVTAVHLQLLLQV
jgi:hypothetical protein